MLAIPCYECAPACLRIGVVFSAYSLERAAVHALDYLAKVITGATFKDGIETAEPSQIAA